MKLRLHNQDKLCMDDMTVVCADTSDQGIGLCPWKSCCLTSFSSRVSLIHPVLGFTPASIARVCGSKPSFRVYVDMSPQVLHINVNCRSVTAGFVRLWS